MTNQFSLDFFPYLFLVTGINNRAGFKDEATRPDYQRESGEIFHYKDTPIIDIYPVHEYTTIEISILC